MSHVVPDLVQKVLKGQDPLHILGERRPGASLHVRRRPRPWDRHGDGAPGGAERGLQPLDAELDDRARARRGDLAEGARAGPSVPSPCTTPRSLTTCSAGSRRSEKARRVLGFEATTSLDEMLDEVVPWVATAIENGTI